MKITNSDAASSILLGYLANAEIDIELLKGDPNFFQSDHAAEHLCSFLMNYMKLKVPADAVMRCETVADVIAIIEAYLPYDESEVYYRLMNLYSVQLSRARKELKEFHTEHLRLTRALQKQVNEIEDLVMDITEENNYDGQTVE